MHKEITQDRDKGTHAWRMHMMSHRWIEWDEWESSQGDIQESLRCSTRHNNHKRSTLPVQNMTVES